MFNYCLTSSRPRITARCVCLYIMLFLFGGCSQNNNSVNIKNAIETFENEDYQTAYRQFEKLYDEPLPHYYLGTMFSKGYYIEIDNNKAFEHYLIAADKGVSEAAFNVALYYLDGIGTAQNSTLAVQYFEKAATADNPQAAFNLAVIYGEKDSVLYDLVNSKKYLEKAVDLKLPEAFLLRSYKYLNAIDYPQNIEKGLADLNAAIELNSSDAEFVLGMMYYFGRGTEKDTEKGLAFIKSAAKKHNPDALIICGLILTKSKNHEQSEKLYQTVKDSIGDDEFNEKYKKYMTYFTQATDNN